jgi:hypothetical protein
VSKRLLGLLESSMEPEVVVEFYKMILVGKRPKIIVEDGRLAVRECDGSEKPTTLDEKIDVVKRMLERTNVG